MSSPNVATYHGIKHKLANLEPGNLLWTGEMSGSMTAVHGFDGPALFPTQELAEKSLGVAAMNRVLDGAANFEFVEVVITVQRPYPPHSV